MACQQAHPALIKIGLVLARLFHFNSLLVCIRCVRTKGLTDCVSSRPGAMAALWRPHPAGTRQYICINNQVLLGMTVVEVSMKVSA